MWFFSVPASECAGRTSGQGILFYHPAHHSCSHSYMTWICQFWGFHSGVVTDAILLDCDNTLLS